MGAVHLDIGDWVAAPFISSFVLGPISVLFHEMGHATVALRVSKPYPVRVAVGYGTPAVTVSFERLTVRFCPVIFRRGTFQRGICRWNPAAASAKDRLQMILAGPIATALLIPVYGLIAWLARGDAQWISASFFFGAIDCIAVLLFNLDTREKAFLGTIHPSTLRRDGIQARDAYRQMRAGL